MGARQKMMTGDEIQAEFGWSREMVYTLLEESGQVSARACACRGTKARSH
jgi:hypothetical protein